jgi:hypothetical protein
MTAHVSGAQIERYLAHALPPAEILSLHDHLETCAECRHALAMAAPAGLSLLGPSAGPHLTEDEMVAFTARRLAEPRRAAAERHMASCFDCRDAVSAMESERARPVAFPDRPRRAWFVLAGAIAAILLVGAVVHYWPVHPNSPPRPAIVASLRDSGGAIELDSTGALRGLEGASPEERNLVREALRQRSLPAGATFAAQAPGVLLGPDAGVAASFALLSPIDTRVLSDRPVFTWKPYPGAAHYQVIVTNEALDPLARSGMIPDTTWRPETRLPRNTILLWQVRAWHDGEMISTPAPPAPPARFEIAAQPIADRLQQLRTSPRSSHLLAAVLCAREGLRDEAAQEIAILARENPGSPLIGSLQSAPPVR